MADTNEMNPHSSLLSKCFGRLRARMTAADGGDRGSTLVEAAFVMPVFVMLIFGIFEFSGVTMTRTGSGAAVKAGSRMAVVMGNDPHADLNILRRIKSEGAGIAQDHITKVVIWNAAKPGEQVPTTCLTSGVNKGTMGVNGPPAYGSCNVYTSPQGNAFEKATRPLMQSGDTYGPAYADWYFGCEGPSDPEASHKIDCDWPPKSRNIREPSETLSCPSPRPTRPQVAAGADPRCMDTDLVGIYIEVEHKHYTGFFGNMTTITDSATAKIEPQEYAK